MRDIRNSSNRRGKGVAGQLAGGSVRTKGRPRDSGKGTMPAWSAMAFSIGRGEVSDRQARGSSGSLGTAAAPCSCFWSRRYYVRQTCPSLCRSSDRDAELRRGRAGRRTGRNWRAERCRQRLLSGKTTAVYGDGRCRLHLPYPALSFDVNINIFSIYTYKHRYTFVCRVCMYECVCHNRIHYGGTICRLTTGRQIAMYEATHEDVSSAGLARLQRPPSPEGTT